MTQLIVAKSIVSPADSLHSLGQAMLVHNGRIKAIGNPADFSTVSVDQYLDLQDYELFPGFVESHAHLWWMGQVLSQIDCGPPDCVTVHDILSRVRDACGRCEPGTWIVGHHWDDSLLEEQRAPTFEELTRVAPYHPVYLVHSSGHLALANQLAFKIAGVSPTLNIPGIIVRNQQFTGLLSEALALETISRHIPVPTADEMQLSLQKAVNQCHRQGVTSAADAALGLGDPQSVEPIWRAYQKAEEEQILTVRTQCYVRVIDRNTFIPSEPPSDFLSVAGVKLFSDGSIQGHTARLFEPYHDQPHERGILLKSSEELVELIHFFDQRGLQIAIHGNGDEAIATVVRAYEVALGHQESYKRHRIEHAQMAGPDHLLAMRKLGILPNFFIGHVFHYGDRHRDRFLGIDRASQLDPLATALKLGIPFALHSDAPVTPINPLASIATAVTRKTSSHQILGLDERIPLSVAWKAYTRWAAYLGFRETQVGSFGEGMWADFIALNHNPFQDGDLAQLESTRVIKTFVGGALVYSA